MPRKPSSRHPDLALILERLEALEARVARLEGENQAAVAVAADFGVVAPAAPTAPPVSLAAPAAIAVAASAAAQPEPAEEVSEEILLVISAAVAAFLGERAHVRQVRLLHSDAWAQQGRVSVMASHRWAVHR